MIEFGKKGIGLLLLFFCLGMTGVQKGVKITGMGWWNNFKLHQNLKLLEGQESLNFIYLENALWLLDEEVKKQGYLQPSFEVTLSEGVECWKTKWKEGIFEPSISTDFDAEFLKIRVDRGPLYYFDRIEAKNCPEFSKEQINSYFYDSSVLYLSESDRYFTEVRVKKGIDRLLQTLRELGYQKAEIKDLSVEKNEQTGAVFVQFCVEKGLRFYVNKVTVFSEASVVKVEEIHKWYSPLWFQDYVQKVRMEYYRQGYPDVLLQMKFIRREERDGQAVVDLNLIASPGKCVSVGSVVFSGTKNTSQRLMEGKDLIRSGDLLDIERIQHLRDRLMRLGIFKDVAVSYQKTTEEKWDVLFCTQLKDPLVFSLIFGVGTFDVIRGGFELQQNNLFGLAHRAKLTTIQSFNSTSLDYRYTIPEFYWEDVQAFAWLNFLKRDEIPFVRKEMGVTMGLEEYIRRYNTSLTLQYSQREVRAQGQCIDADFGLRSAVVTSVGFIASSSRISPPLFPEKGYSVTGSLEVAFPEMGGEVEFERLELAGAYHFRIPWIPGAGLHLSLKHGFITTQGSTASNIPIAKRFFPGGENTVRGYRRGQASSRSSDGVLVGSQTYALLNVEYEQRVTDFVSVVTFMDALGIGLRIADYPFNEGLWCFGGGINLRTFLGPLRFEYGRNVNPRAGDPWGTFQFALGVPF